MSGSNPSGSGDAGDKPVSSGVFIGGKFQRVETTRPEPEIRKLPPVFPGSALAYVSAFSDGRRKPEE